ncbi:MAG: PQQ-dependent sugar dehydrogenase [Solirubrobacteraceae bacterium]
MLWRALGLAIVVGVLVPASASAGVKATPIGTFRAPTYIAAPPGDTQRLFVVQQGGQIELMTGGQSTPFLNISSEVTFVSSGEQGLLSMAFAPDYATSHRFYVYYTDKNCDGVGGCDEHVSEFTADPPGFDTASLASEHVLLTIPHPNETNHNGGQLQFGPDGDLYISVGDGGGGDDTELKAQHTDRLLGKLLRISPGPTSYTIPAGNPFNGQPLCSSGTNGGSSCPEIWAYGLRNPWRVSFDSATSDLIIADVGQNRDEEIDFAHPGQNIGANYGWPCYEGFELNATAPAAECSPLPTRVVAPVLSYPHPGNCAGQPFCGDDIIGGYVMHDPTLPSLNGCYVFGDLSNPDLQVVGLAQPSAVGQVALGPQVSNLSSFGVDASGHLYAADIGSGIVYRLDSDGNAATDPTCPTAIPVKHPPVNTSRPKIAGPPIPGARLTCIPGTWTGANSFAYEWLRDGAKRAAGVTYRPTPADLGHVLSCVVTARNADGSAQATSAAVRIIRDAPPLLYAPRISPTAFIPARSGPSVMRAGRRGATVSFRLDEPATVTFTAGRALSGHRVNGRCRVAAYVAARSCTVWRPVKGSFRVNGKRGLNRLHFSGRIGHRALALGHYRLNLRARDNANRVSETVRVQFTISR